MLLALDIGNTGLAWSLFTKRFMRGNGRCQDEEDIQALIDDLPRDLKTVIAVTVAPSRARVILEKIHLNTGLSPRLARKDFPIPIANFTLAPERVGHDRLLAALAAYERKKSALLVVDVGTAITMDFVDAEGRFRGGAIMPGANIGGRALHRYTESLPRVKPARPREIIGRDTEDAIQAGLYWGTVSAVEGMLARMRGAVGDVAAVFTGGDGEWLAAELGVGEAFFPSLTLEGLLIAYENRPKHSPARGGESDEDGE